MRLAELKAARIAFADSEKEVAKKSATLVSRREALLKRLRAAFDGAVNFEPFVTDIFAGRHDEAIGLDGGDIYKFALLQARAWHALAIERLKTMTMQSAAGPIAQRGWSNGIPYCIRVPTAAMFAEAGQ